MINFISLKEHYQGVADLSFDATQAELGIQELFYRGEKKPSIWQDKFKRHHNKAFITIHKKEGRNMYTNEMKLRTLMKKVKDN